MFYHFFLDFILFQLTFILFQGFVIFFFEKWCKIFIFHSVYVYFISSNDNFFYGFSFSFHFI